MAYQKKWDWESIRLEYIIGELVTDEYGNETRKPYSTKRLAEKHGIPFNTLADRCHKDKWVQDKNRLDIELKRRVTEEKVTQIFGESVISSSYTLKQLGKINTIIDAYLEPYLNLIDSDRNQNISVRTVINEDGLSNTEILGDEDVKKINPRDIKDIVSIIKEVHNLKKSIYGDEQLQTAVTDIKTKDKAQALSRLKGTNKIESQLDMLLKERKKMEAKLNSPSTNNEENKQEIEIDEDDE
jgi:septal ring factor EnvC (AmiA/AmiB activator)